MGHCREFGVFDEDFAAAGRSAGKVAQPSAVTGQNVGQPSKALFPSGGRLFCFPGNDKRCHFSTMVLIGKPKRNIYRERRNEWTYG